MAGLTAERQKKLSPENEGIINKNGLASSLGRPLDPVTLSTMGSLFGYDFGRVRVHEGQQAAQSARELNALAFTVGNDVFFNANQYRMGTEEGTRLLAHELTHVVQQSAGLRSSRMPSQSSTLSETEAMGVESAIVRHSGLPRISQMGVGVMRKEGDSGGQGVKEDSNVVELKTKVKKLVAEKFGGDYKKAFDYYAKNGSVGPDELKTLLSDAGVGNFATRGAWVSAIIKKLDTNGNGKIEWNEFAAILG